MGTSRAIFLALLGLLVLAAACTGAKDEQQPVTRVTDAKKAEALSETAGPSCPLPKEQNAKAVAAFTAMLPVLQHPRCA